MSRAESMRLGQFFQVTMVLCYDSTSLFLLKAQSSQSSKYSGVQFKTVAFPRVFPDSENYKHYVSTTGPSVVRKRSRACCQIVIVAAEGIEALEHFRFLVNSYFCFIVSITPR
jgi:hypothetical protein